MAQLTPPEDPQPVSPQQLAAARFQMERFLMSYEAGIDEVETKLRILQREFTHTDDYNPIEHIDSRLKSIDSLAAKAHKRGCGSLAEIRREVTDIAGIRVVCSFRSDVYRVKEFLLNQSDVNVLVVKDYVTTPKPNGYRSLHAIVEVPVFLSEQIEHVPVEVQFRTIAMDFWASLEHKIYYKYEGDIPDSLLAGLQSAAETSAQLDDDMERLHNQIKPLTTPSAADDAFTMMMLRRLLMTQEVVDGGPIV